jgi:uncharacterized protein (TIGR02284 family)
MMNAPNEKIVSALNHLIITCKDGQEGFHNAGEEVKSAELKQVFLKYEEQRKQLVAELQPEVRSRGGDPEKGGTVSGALHRGWLNLKQLLGGGNETAVVDEAERSEDIAMASYQAALKEELPPAVRLIVQRQFDQIKLAHDQISLLKKAHHPAA